MSTQVDAHNNGDCWSPSCPMCEWEDANRRCERCDEYLADEQHCTHGRDLCEGCLHHCRDCNVEFAESRAYDDDRDES